MIHAIALMFMLQQPAPQKVLSCDSSLADHPVNCIVEVVPSPTYGLCDSHPCPAPTGQAAKPDGPTENVINFVSSYGTVLLHCDMGTGQPTHCAVAEGYTFDEAMAVIYKGWQAADDSKTALSQENARLRALLESDKVILAHDKALLTRAKKLLDEVEVERKERNRKIQDLQDYVCNELKANNRPCTK
jgi:hypothetical protein